MTDDPTTLASAYLDGEATSGERDQVEGDAGLLAEVERLRRVRAVLTGTVHDDATAAISVRERHLAAALEVWDRIPASELTGDSTPHGVDAAAAAGTASLTSPGELLERRQRRARLRTGLLTAAAALIVVAGAGLVISDATSNDDSENFATDAAADTSDGFAEQSELEAGALAAADETFSEADDAAEEPAVELAEAPAADASGEDIGGILGGPDQAPPEDELPVLASDDDLGDFANGVLEAQARNQTARDASDAVAADEPSAQPEGDAQTSTAQSPVGETIEPAFNLCDLVDVVLGPAYWAAPGLFDRPVVVGIDEANNEVVAYVESDCTEVARVPVR